MLDGRRSVERFRRTSRFASSSECPRCARCRSCMRSNARLRSDASGLILVSRTTRFGETTRTLIVDAARGEALGHGMKSIGARLALAVNRIARRKGRVVAERYHVRLLPTPREVRNALRYVLLDAREHAARSGSPGGAVARLFDPASSARWFEGWKREGVVTGRAPASRPRAAPSPVARARTWLLSVGWRKHGLLDPADVPG